MDGIILFADNKIFENGYENNLFKLFRQNQDYSVLPIDSLSCLEATIKSSSTFKACIIDWDFADSGDFNEDFNEDFFGVERPSRTPLAILQNYSIYSLLYVYSGIDIPVTDKGVLEEKYGAKIRFRTKKNDVEKEYRAILEDVKEFEANNPHMEIPFIWSQTINQSAQTIFNELETADPCWIKEIKDTAQQDGGDASTEVIGVFHDLLNENLIQSECLRNKIDEFSLDKEVSKEENTAKLYQRIFYSRLTEHAPIMTGDIFHFSDDIWGILITPECEVQKRIKDSKALEFLSFYVSDTDEHLIKRCSFDKTKVSYSTLKDDRKNNLRKMFNNDDVSIHILPSFPYKDEVYNQMVVINFKSSFSTKRASEYRDRRTSYKLNSPYIYQLRQRFISFFGKYGVPAMPESLRDFNLR